MGSKPLTEHIFSGFDPITDLWTASPSVKNGVIPFAASGVHRSGNPEGVTGKGSRLLADWLLTYRTLERVRDDFDRGLQCLEPLLAIASMRPLARMAENVPLDILFDSG
jgi:hypothetical protein